MTTHCPINNSAFRNWWRDMDNGCPQLVLDNDEDFAVAVWNAAIERVLLEIPGGSKWAQEKEDRYDQMRCCCDESQSAWGDVEATDSCSSFLPNGDVEPPRERKANGE